MSFKFELNTRVKDKVSGFEGIILGRTEYATGCIQYGVSPTELDNGKLREWEWFDESRLIIVPAKGISDIKKNGGPQPRAPKVN